MLTELGKKAKEAEKTLMIATTEQKNKALKYIAQALIENADEIGKYH